jgi:U4/U6.U5 tri-snRNP component SNU23
MGDSKKPAYDQPTSDTSHRKTYDLEAYAQKAKDREAHEKEESKARYEAKLAGQKYHPRPPTPPDAKDTTARTARLDVASFVGKTSLVPAGAAVGKRGKGAGFYCEECDLTFKDNLQWVDHLNSRQHLVNTGQSGEVKRAGLQEVRERLEWLREKKRRERDEVEGVLELGERLRVRKEEDDKEREEKREKRRLARRAKTEESGDRVKVEGVDAVMADEGDMASMMGFGGFGSTKV